MRLAGDNLQYMEQTIPTATYIVLIGPMFGVLALALFGYLMHFRR